MPDTLTARLRQFRDFLSDLVLGPQPWDAVGSPVPDLFATSTALAVLGSRTTYPAAFEGRIDV